MSHASTSVTRWCTMLFQEVADLNRDNLTLPHKHQCTGSVAHAGVFFGGGVGADASARWCFGTSSTPECDGQSFQPGSFNSLISTCRLCQHNMEQLVSVL